MTGTELWPTGGADAGAKPAQSEPEPDAVPGPLPDAAGVVGAGVGATTAAAASRPSAPSAPSAPPPAPPPAPQRSSPVGAVIGGVLAAGIGFGVAWYGYEQGILGARPDTSALEAQMSELQASVASLDADNSALQSQLAGLDVVSTDELDARDAQIEGLSAAVAGLQERIEAREALNIASPDDLDDVSRALGENLNRLSAVEDEVAALVASDAVEQLAEDMDSRMGAQEETSSRLAVQVSSVQAELSGLLDEIAAVRELAEMQLADVQAEAEAAAADAAARAAHAEAGAALATIAGALESGAPFATPLARVEAAGTTPPDALQAVAADGVATVAELQDSFTPAARAGLAASLQHTDTDSTTDRLTNFLRSQVGARSLAAREGDDPDAVMSRAEAAVREGDIPRALDEIATLPQAGIAAMGAWHAQASARVAAQAALADLQQTFDAG